MAALALAKYWQLIVGAVGCLVLSVLLVIQKGETRHWRKLDERAETNFALEKSAFAQMASNYRAAVATSRANAIASKASIENQYAVNNERVRNDYQARLDSARAEYERLRNTSRNGGQTVNVRSLAGSMPGVSNPASGTTPLSGQNELSLDDRWLCTAQSIQLDELIKWINTNAKVKGDTK